MTSRVGRYLGGLLDRALAKGGGAAAPTFAELSKRAQDAADAARQDPARTASLMKQLRDEAVTGKVGKNPIDDITPEARHAAAMAQLQAEAARNPAAHSPSSVLFVPCSNAKALAKVPGLAADAFILDLEDAVPAAKKSDAREALVKACNDRLFDGKRVYVRVNSPRTAPQWGFDDLDACGLCEPFIAGVCLPKTQAGDLELLEANIHPNMRLWAFVETVQGVLDAEAIAATKRYDAMVIGTNDLAAELGLPAMAVMREAFGADVTASMPSPRYALLHSLSRIVLAARAHNLPVLDGVFNDPTNPSGFLREAVEGKVLGFDGKTLIHPSQIAPCNTVFDPTTEEVAWANKVVKAMATAGGGVAVVEGQMVEDLHARRAQVVLTRAQRTDKRDNDVRMAKQRQQQLTDAKTAAERDARSPRSVASMLADAADGIDHEELQRGATSFATHAPNPREDIRDDRIPADEIHPDYRAAADAPAARTDEPTSARQFNEEVVVPAGDAEGSAPLTAEALRAADAARREERRAERRKPGTGPSRQGGRDFRMVKGEERYPDIDDTATVRLPK